METPWHYYTMASLYILAGVLHWIYPRVYEKITPHWIPFKSTAVALTGMLEVGFGIGLFFPVFREPSLYGIMILLLLFLPVHTHMLQDPKAAMGIPSWALFLRIPLQGLLMYWAYGYL